MRSSTSQFITILTSASLASSAVIPGISWNPSTVLKRASLAGEATYYGGNVQGGACSFSTYTLPDGIYGTALSDSNWDNAGNCGVCVEVTGPSGNSVTAMVCLFLFDTLESSLERNWFPVMFCYKILDHFFF